MKYQLQIIMLLSAFVFLIGVFSYGYYKGSLNELSKIEKERLNTQEQLFDLAEDLSLKTSKLIRLNNENKGLIHELEQSAIKAKGSNNPGISTIGGLQRLKRRWSKSGSIR
jgi:hypothetical protein